MIKTIHLLTAVLSISGFFLRGIMMIRGSSMLGQRWVKVLPHVNDTALLISAIALAYQTQQYPFVSTWLTAKVIALVLYIILGMTAFRFARQKTAKIASWILAQMVFIYIVLIALTRNPLIF